MPHVIVKLWPWKVRSPRTSARRGDHEGGRDGHNSSLPARPLACKLLILKSNGHEAEAPGRGHDLAASRRPADHDRIARFQREAEVLASLNHPHSAGIYGLEESAGVTALVMELLEGEDLAQRIARG